MINKQGQFDVKNIIPPRNIKIFCWVFYFESPCIYVYAFVVDLSWLSTATNTLKINMVSSNHDSARSRRIRDNGQTDDD